MLDVPKFIKWLHAAGETDDRIIKKIGLTSDEIRSIETGVVTDGVKMRIYEYLIEIGLGFSDAPIVPMRISKN